MSPLVWFGTGFTSGVFVAFLAWLFLAVPPDPRAPELALPEDPAPDPTPTKSNVLGFDFYEMFPKSEVPVVEEYLPDGEKRLVEQVAWLIQVGSFRDPSDADALRARLILEGFEVRSHPTPVDGRTFHRVVLGPITSRAEVERIEDRLDAANVPLLRVRVTR